MGRCLRGGRIGEEGRGEKKGWKGVVKSLRGKIFRENSGNPQTARSDKDLLRPKHRDRHPFGAITYPLPPPCLRPYVSFGGFSLLIYNSLMYNTLKVMQRMKKVLYIYCYVMCMYVFQCIISIYLYVYDKYIILF